MAAAQAAAEAAMRDAVNRERLSNNNNQQHQQQHQQHQQQHAADISSLLQFQSQQDAAQATAAQHLLNQMMGLSGHEENGDTNMESILQIIAQHEQQQQQAAQFEQIQEQVPERPSVHYMTIAEDGTCDVNYWDFCQLIVHWPKINGN